MRPLGSVGYGARPGMHLLILSRNAQLYSTSRLVLAARSRGHEVTVADPLDFQIVISRGRPSMYLGDRPVPHADLVVPRIGASVTNYGSRCGSST